MKKCVFILVCIFGFVFLQSCEGPSGPRGPQGSQGIPGVESEVFEVTTSFADANGYSSTFVLNPPIFASDNVLVYELREVINGQNVWKLLPQTYFFDLGIMTYNYDFTKNDFRLFLNATFDLHLLDPSWKNNITFRIVVIPGYFSLDQIDTSDINAVMNAFDLKDSQIFQLHENTTNFLKK